jgi:sugar transferase (PEP-CTERM/EpsH1 system associated)
VNVLFLTSRLPFPPVGGDRLRTFQFVKYLSRRHRVTIASFVEHEDEVKDAEAYRDLYDRVIPVVLPRAASYRNCLLGLASTEPLQVHYYASPRMHQVVAEELATHSYDVIFLHMIRMAQYMPESSNVRKVVDFCDAVSLLHRRSARLPHGTGMSSLINRVETLRVGAYEREAIEKADASILISPVDADHFRQAGYAGRIEVVSNGVDVDQFAFNTDRRDDDHIVFVGNMRTFPNTDAVVYFVEEVLPTIRKTRPAAKFYIVGNEPSKRVRALHDGERVIVTGRVDSVIPYVSGAAVVVAPMRACAGVQNKILESLAVGTPVVATTMGAEGLEPGIMTVADSPDDFARAVVELMTDPNKRRERALAGRHYVETHCTWEKSLEKLDEVLAGTPAGRNRALESTRA